MGIISKYILIAPLAVSIVKLLDAHKHTKRNCNIHRTKSNESRSWMEADVANTRPTLMLVSTLTNCNSISTSCNSHCLLRYFLSHSLLKNFSMQTISKQTHFEKHVIYSIWTTFMKRLLFTKTLFLILFYCKSKLLNWVSFRKTTTEVVFTEHQL